MSLSLKLKSRGMELGALVMSHKEVQVAIYGDIDEVKFNFDRQLQGKKKRSYLSWVLKND